MKYEGGPLDGQECGLDEFWRPTVQAYVGTLDVTPPDIITPVRRVEIVASYKVNGDSLTFVDVQAKYRTVDL